MDALPDDLLLRILALLPDDKQDFLDMDENEEFGGVTVSSRGAAEHVCERWRRLALVLPASRIKLDFDEGVWGTDHPGFMPALLEELGSRAVGRVQIEHAPDSLPDSFWEALGKGLVARASGLAIHHDPWQAGSPLPSAAVQLLAWGSALEELDFFISDGNEEDESLPPKLADAIRAMPRLREVSIHGVMLTPDLATALASRPLIGTVQLDPANGLEHLAEGVWEPLAQLGDRLKSMYLIVWMAALGHAPDPPMRHQLPPGLLALTGLGRLDMLLIGYDAVPGSRLGGLERTPLHTLQTDGGTPVEAWSCMQLSELHALNDPIAMPRASQGELPPLCALDLSCWTAARFPAALCGLSRLTDLYLSSCNFTSSATLPSEVSQLSALQRLRIRDTRLDAASINRLAPLARLTQLALSQCGISSLPAGPYLHGLVELSIDGNAFQPRREPIPPSVLGAAAQLTSLTVSLDASLAELQEQWPQVEAALLKLSKLKSLGVSFLPEGGATRESGRLRRLPANSDALAHLTKLKKASELRAFGVRDIGERRRS